MSGSIFRPIVKVVAIIQARMGSTRLPGKVLKGLVGQTVLGWVVTRTRRAALVNEVVVATTTERADDAIVQESECLDVACFRGSEADVLDRYYRAAQIFSADAVVRITADCPLIDPELIDETIQVFLEQGTDYATNSLIVTYPRGLDVEVFTSAALGRAWSEAEKGYQRTHVTPYFYESVGLFRVSSIQADADYSRYRWTLDTPQDFQLIQAVCQHFGNRGGMRWREILAFIDGHPEIGELNKDVRQKALQEG
jgi:spore coat polysaccharide biosynthesis protein SpsF